MKGLLMNKFTGIILLLVILAIGVFYSSITPQISLAPKSSTRASSWPSTMQCDGTFTAYGTQEIIDHVIGRGRTEELARQAAEAAVGLCETQMLQRASENPDFFLDQIGANFACVGTDYCLLNPGQPGSCEKFTDISNPNPQTPPGPGPNDEIECEDSSYYGGGISGLVRWMVSSPVIPEVKCTATCRGNFNVNAGCECPKQ
jgi:hypothetical protein